MQLGMGMESGIKSTGCRLIIPLDDRGNSTHVGEAAAETLSLASNVLRKNIQSDWRQEPPCLAATLSSLSPLSLPSLPSLLAQHYAVLPYRCTPYIVH
jgi:hypothetical protein